MPRGVYSRTLGCFLSLHLKTLYWAWNLPLGVHTSVANDSGSLFSLLQTVTEAAANRVDAFWGLRREGTVFWLIGVLAFLASLAVPSGDLPGR